VTTRFSAPLQTVPANRNKISILPEQMVELKVAFKPES
jgi:hypothetical protein